MRGGAMKLTTGYAPTTYRRPCLIVDTAFNAKTRETAVIFVEALNVGHAYSFDGDHAPPHSEWVVIQEHASVEDAIAYHLAAVRDFHNGGSNEEWEAGMPAYLALYEAHCPAEFKKRLRESARC